MTAVTQHDDDDLLPQFGYKQQFVRSLRHFESFAVAFSFISITTGAGDLGRPLTALRVDGGLTRSRVLLQAQADLLQLPVEVCPAPDATALGVAALARLGTGVAASVGDAVGPVEPETVIEPSIGAAEAAERLAAFEGGLQAVLAASQSSSSSP